MAKNFILVSILFLFTTFSSAQSWSIISRVPSATNINSISVVDQNIIWAACNGGYIYLTTNGGQTWQLHNSGLAGTDLYGVCGLDTMNCWVGTINGAIYHTSDGGTNWTQQIAVSGSFIDGIKMFDKNNGVYYGDPTWYDQPFQFRYTTDGGTTWTLAPDAPIANSAVGVINDWDWTDQNHFWIGSGKLAPFVTSDKIFYTSTGFTGTFYFTNVDGTGNLNGLYYQAIALTDTSSGLVASDHGDIKKTTDGGHTWNVTNPPLVGGFVAINMNGLKDGSGIIRLALIDNSSKTHIYSTSDLGNTWQEETIPTEVTFNHIQHIQFLNANLGFAGAQSGYFLKYSGTTPVVNLNKFLPANFSLSQNYPNPFNPTTSIKFELPHNNFVSLKVFNTLGQEVADLVDENVSAGTHAVTFDASNLTSGVYFYILKVGQNGNDFIKTDKMIFMK